MATAVETKRIEYLANRLIALPLLARVKQGPALQAVKDSHALDDKSTPLLPKGIEQSEHLYALAMWGRLPP